MLIRKFDAPDTEPLLRLFYDTVHTVNSKDYPKEHLNAWAQESPDVKKWKDKFKSHKTYVALLDGKIVGFGSLDKDHTSVGMLYVHKDHQRQGVATALLEKLEEKLQKDDIKNTEAESSITARSFFEKRGYVVNKENRKMLNGIEFLNFIMEKKLAPKEKSDMKEKVKEAKPFKWRDLFFNKVFDLMIVIVGVSVAFQLNNLKLSSDQQSLEQFYMESMIGDLRKDKSQIEQILVELKADQKSINDYLAANTNSSDSLGRVVFNILSLETFTPNQNTYQMLLSGNGLTAISDREVRSQTTEFYNTYLSIKRFEEVDTQLVFEIFGYFSPYSDIGAGKILDPTIVQKPQTKNYLLATSAQLSDGIDAHSIALEKATKLIETIENKLRRL